MKGYKSQNTSPIWMYLTLVVLAFFLIFIAYPLSLVLYRSFYNQQTQTLTLEYFTRFFTRKYFTNTIINSFKVTFSATIVSSILGLAIAYITRSSKIKGSKWLNILIVVSYLSPPFIGAYAWIQLLGRNGLITKYINAWFGMNFEGIYGFIGIVLVFSLQSFPLVYMYVAGALKNLDNSLNEAAESLGSSTLQRISMVIMPLIVPTLLASSLLVFMRVFSDFGTPMLIGEGYRTFPVVLYSQFMGEVAQDDNFAAALCIIIMIITLVFFFAQRMIARKMSYSMTALKPMQAVQKKGLTNVLQHVFVYFVVFLGILPQLTVIATSFMEFSGGHVFTGRLTLENFRNTLLNKGSNAVWNTYLFGISAILIVVVLGIIISYLAVRKSSFLTSTLDTLTMLPYVIPGSVLGISFLYAFNTPPLLLSGTAVILIVSLCVRRLPYTIRSSSAIIGQISPSLEEAAISLGAGEIRAFVQVIIPMMLPGVIAGAIMSWVTVISELSSSIILYTSRTATLTVSIYTEVIRSNFGNAAAYSTVLTFTSIASLLLFFKISGKNDISI